MTAITASQVKDLREKTGAGMMDAKNALVEAGGDMEKAAEILRQKGIATAEKKSGRVAAEGLVQAVLGQRCGVLVEVNCETDFVARGEAFQEMVKEVGQHILEKAPADVDALLEQASLQTGTPVRDYITDKIGQIKENLSVRRFIRYQRETAGVVHSYIHTGGKIGVLVNVGVGSEASLAQPAFQQMVKDIAMQIASSAPEFVSRNEIPKEVIDAETRVEMGKEDILSKPAEIRAKIVAGRVDKLLAQRVLLEQPFVKDPAKTIQQLVEEVGQQLKDTVELTAFTRYVLGEGIEKKESNFAEEVLAAAQAH